MTKQNFSEKIFNSLKNDANIVLAVNNAIEAINTPFDDACFFFLLDEIGKNLNWKFIPLELGECLITYHIHLRQGRIPDNPDAIE